MNNTLIFEGAGWEKSSSASDIGNCRIRTRIKNNEGEIIYLEMMGVEKQVRDGGPGLIGYISHCFVGTDCNESKSQYRKLENNSLIWDAKHLLKWVNKNLNCSFNALDVQNDGVRVHDTKLPLCESKSDLVVVYES